MLPECFGYPGKLHLSIADDVDTRTDSRHSLLQAWCDLTKFESLALHHAGLKTILNAVHWRTWTCVRLVMALNEMEKAHPDGQATSKLIHNILMKITDEKHAEDIHQFLRDTGRFKRSSGVGPTRLMRAVLECDPCGKKGMRKVDVSVSQIIHTARQKKLEPVAPKLRTPPKHWPAEFDKLTSPHTWSSTTAEGDLTGIAAWEWLQYWLHNIFEAGLNMPITASFRSRCITKQHVLCDGDKHWFVIAVQLFGLLLCFVCSLSPIHLFSGSGPQQDQYYGCTLCPWHCGRYVGQH